ncbi:hypothetical protein QUF90_06815 [Desulfococcaceae bacterium HSG9]|nr:hypothetical protein [Desulfococcaceae bacterium HSG9]
MNQEQFEQLSKKIMGKVLDCDDQEKLLKISCHLLHAQAAILLECHHRNGKIRPEILSAYPKEDIDFFKSNITKLRKWYDISDLPENNPGFAENKEIWIGKKVFPSALVAFGNQEPITGKIKRELILIKNPTYTGPYLSYHCWAAAVLLRHYEYFIIEKEILAKEKLHSKQLVLNINEILPNMNYKEIEESVKELDHIEKWKRYIIWVGYQVRKKRADEKFKNLKSIKEEIIKLKEPDLILGQSIQFLLNELVETDTKTFLCELAERITKGEYKTFSSIGAIVLEHGWRIIRKNIRIAETNLRPVDNKYLINEIEPLLELTKVILAYALCNKKDGESQKTEEKIEIGRGFLRLYFAYIIIAESPRLYSLYLNQEATEKRTKAPDELKRIFILNLSRFILAAVAILQKQKLDMFIEPTVITPAEELDSLLYIVDRYGHIELGIDETIHIRELLANQTTAEIRHYMAQAFYRDHLLHVIDVFLLGHLLLHTNICWQKKEKKRFVEQLSNRNEQLTLSDERGFLKNWAVASLLHDIGYQIGEGSNISQEQKVWEVFFKLKEPIKAKWLEFTFAGSANKINPKKRIGYLKNLVKEICNSDGLKKCFPEQLSDSITDHGVLSALRIVQILINSEHSQAFNEKLSDHKQAEKYFYAIHAIAHHNLHGECVHFKSHPISCLLRLCDELQEWSRKRVNNEKIVKDLYLDIQYDRSGKIVGYELFKSFMANLEITIKKEENTKSEINIGLIANESETAKPRFEFSLTYRDALQANFIPMIALMCKAYNLQYLDLSETYFGEGDLSFALDLFFPKPNEFKWLTEYDIYGLFTEKDRRFSLLELFDSIKDGRPGLIRLRDKSDQGDHFGIIISRKNNPEHHQGWLHTNPNYIYEDYKDFREKYLADKRLYLKPSSS